MLGTLIDRAIATVAPGWGLSRLAAREQLRMLSTYAAASKSRVHGDWNPKSTSADRAIVPDMATINARARAMCNDTPHGAAIKRAFPRKVVGRGITPMPIARDDNGRELTDFNNRVLEWWRRWSKDKNACDVERKKTLAGFQRLAVREAVLVGHHMIAWSYVPDPRGPKDPGSLPGLRLTSIEPEQLDTTSLRNHENGNEIRAGIEIDEFTAPVAFHFHRRHPQDALFRREEPVRIEAERIWHIFDQDRVQQTHGASQLSPSLIKLRNTEEYDQTQLWAARMEACIGLIRKRKRSSGDLASAPDKGEDYADQISFSPGMVAETWGDDELQPFMPTRPGGQYDPFILRQLMAIAAGSGLSYGQITRDFTRGTYSGQRQEMLEDHAEFDWYEELQIDHFLTPCWRQFVTVLAMEGRLDGVAPDFFENPERYMAVEWQGPPRPWIDPLKEVTAATTALLWRLTSRKRLLNQQGQTLRETAEQIRDEGDLFDDLNLKAPDFGGSAESTPTLADDAKVAAPESGSAEGETPEETAENLAALRALRDNLLLARRMLHYERNGNGCPNGVSA